MTHSTQLEAAAALLTGADAILLHTGAGMGVDSGLPDFRGPKGFWKAYPPLAHLGIRFEEMANPIHFDRDPGLAWGFYGHRLKLYQETQPHEGYEIVQAISEARPLFGFTSNIDGHLQTSGLADSQVMEVHGSLMRLQCSQPCSRHIWSARDLMLEIDMSTCRATGTLPHCPSCGAIARPNVLMFGDWSFVDDQVALQIQYLQDWERATASGALVIIEIGAGKAVPTVRMQSERMLRMGADGLIRINPREPEGPEGTISLPMGGLRALQELWKVMK